MHWRDNEVWWPRLLRQGRLHDLLDHTSKIFLICIAELYEEVNAILSNREIVKEIPRVKSAGDSLDIAGRPHGAWWSIALGTGRP